MQANLRRRNLLFLFVLIGVLAGLAWLTLTNHFTAVDDTIIRLVYRWRSAGLTQVMLAISFMGNQALYLASVAILGFLMAQKRWGDVGKYLLLVGGQELINLGSKAMFARPRPDYLPLAHETSYSFPSGHSMGAFVFYGALAIWLRRRKYGPHHSWAWFVIAALIALTVGISRIYLGVHYPSDVLAGFLLGAIWLLIVLTGTSAKTRIAPE